jgi:hypothetical protein
MADTGIDAVKKQRNAEYAKQYRMKRKLLMQQPTSTSSEPQLVGLSGVRHPQHIQTGSNSSTIAADSSNGVTNT